MEDLGKSSHRSTRVHSELSDRNHRGRSALRVLFCALVLHLAGVALFSRGFFLTRVELAEKSSCKSVPSSDGATARKDEDGACWTEPAFKKAVVVVIDALRYDFAAWNESKRTQRRPFENKMPAIRDLLLLRPMNAMLVPFFADPPTTTMQRLKGMVTGGLPTFMEIKDDVASEGVEITEDNFIDLLINDGKRNITFMGDDTWTVLFPKQFNRAFPYPSFNVKDLHTVDNGVLEHLVPEMKRDDWHFLVAHFLGVDHCGHRFGPDNKEMEFKLLQMNQAIDDIVRTMHERKMDDTILLVFGDHGMTEDGNHGGATEEEVGAALFLYSTKPLLLGTSEKMWNKVGNAQGRRAMVQDLKKELGILHPEFDLHSAAKDRQFLLDRRPTVQQIDLAPTLALLLGLPIPFGSLGSIVPELFFVFHDGDEALEESVVWIRRYENLNRAIQVNVGQVLRYLRVYSERAGESQGVPHQLLKKLRDTALAAQNDLESAREKFKFDLISSKQYLDVHKSTYNTLRSVLLDSSEAGRSLWTQFNTRDMVIGFSLIVLGVAVLGVFIAKAGSGKKVRSSIQANTLTGFGSIIAVLFHMLARLSNSYIVAENEVNGFLSASLISCGLLTLLRSKSERRPLFLLVTNLITSRIALNLGPFQWFRGQEAIADDFMLPWFWMNCVLPLLAIALVLTMKVRAVRESSMLFIILFLQIILCLGHWMLQTTSLWIQHGFAEYRLMQPRLVYALGAVGLVISPWANRLDNGSAPFVSLIPPLLLVLGPASPLVILLFLVQTFGLIELSQSEKAALPWTYIAANWSILTVSYFFASGHESNFNKLHYASPFVGFDEFEYYRGGVMMGFNTFGTLIISSLFLPMLAPVEERRFGILIPNHFRFDQVWFIALAAVLFQSFRTATMVAFVAIARRHLMVWAIFAPKFVFDTITMLVLEAFVLVRLFLFLKKETNTKAEKSE